MRRFLYMCAVLCVIYAPLSAEEAAGTVQSFAPTHYSEFVGTSTSTLITKIKAHEVPQDKLYAAIFVGLSDRSITLSEYTWLLGALYRYAEPISGRLATDALFRYLYALPRGTSADEAIAYAKNQGWELPAEYVRNSSIVAKGAGSPIYSTLPNQVTK